MGVRAVLEKAGETVVAEASNGETLLAALESNPCDVLVTDFSMPGGSQGDGLTLIEHILRRFPRLPLIVLTMINNAGVLKTLRSRGVLGLCDKRGSLRDLPFAVKQVALGRMFMSDSIRDAFEEFALPRTAGTADAARLSVRELEVVRMYVSGMTLTQIAVQLKRSAKTVSRQKRDAMRKLGVDHDSHLIEYAREHGMSS
jgi:two-component system capsular synthesis response regulator RcsB